MARLITTRRFERDFRRLPKEMKRRVDEALRLLAHNPYMGLPLRGKLRGLRSLRVGDWRVIYSVNEAEKTVVLRAVKHRRAVYRC